MSTTLSERLERKFPWVAVPHLLTIVAGMQVLVYFILILRSPGAGFEFQKLLEMDAYKVLHGQVWRLLSYVLLPQASGGILVALGAMVLYITGQHLENSWGTFRLTVFFFATTLLVSTGMVLYAQFTPSMNLMRHAIEQVERLLANPSEYKLSAPFVLYAYLTMLLGLKCPNLTFRWMFILPVKASVFGWIAFAGLIWGAMDQRALRIPILLGSIPFAITAFPQLYAWYWLKERVWANRPAFEAAKHQFDDYFSKCQTCGRTDKSDPQLLFRIAADGEEYCSEHLPPPN